MPRPAPIQENPPYLVIRRGMAFWVTETHAQWRATAQALADGVFADTYLYTARGDLWQINTASPPTHAFFKSRLPWQKLSISLDFKRLPPAPLATVQADLADILNSDQALVTHLPDANQLSATEMLTWFTRVETFHFTPSSAHAK